MMKNKPSSRLIAHKTIIEMIKAKNREKNSEKSPKGSDPLRPSSAFICEDCKKIKFPKPSQAILMHSNQFCVCNSSLRVIHSPRSAKLPMKKLNMTGGFGNPSILKIRKKAENFSERALIATGIGLQNQQTIRSASFPDSVRENVSPYQDLTYRENSESEYKFLIFKGNNSSLIHNILGLRANWVEAENGRTNLHFIWHPTSVKIRFDRLMPYLPTQMANHFEFHAQLSNKMLLYSNMVSYCKLKAMDITKLMPVTFPLNMESKDFTSQMSKFVGYFKSNSQNGTKNLWLLKPSGFNRGRGIHIFNDISTLKNLLADVQSSAQNITKPKFAKNPQLTMKFVVQKYIESPLLIDGRKFDIRVWVLVTHEYDCYFFSQGYIRTSSAPFTLTDDQLTSEYVHLTNNAIQKEGADYGKFEDGNQLSFEFLHKYLDQQFPNSKNSLGRIIAGMKELITHSLRSVKGKLNPNQRQFCFEIFGYDFILDSTMKPWLIECNTNPCLELSSPLLQQLIPRMINDAFKLTLDMIFPIKSIEYLNTPAVVPLQESNQWEFLTSLKKLAV
ncbi:unnamed protein product [Blepharisma stoltei]|uniref:Uncharacterized protein n=1 Tax=Blepharisma stoltei TaxID=1481888 RepID=A0AAU9IVH4_9CILI|nr:unnamed protein product [Blepharisma stoltei]